MDARIRKVSDDQSLESIDATDLDELTAIVVVNSDRQISGLISKSAMTSIMKTSNQATPVRSSRRVSEIPAFGWIQ
jgi:hypothetical protein